MMKAIYSLLHDLIRFSGLADLIRAYFTKRKVTIILYHNPDPVVFKMHLDYLAKKYKLISLKDFSDAIYSGDESRLPSNAMIITFDDGWKENYKLLPLIREYRFRPTIFLTSHLINTERHFWWTECDPNDIARLKSLPEEQRLNELRRINQYDQEKEYPGVRQALNLKELQEMKEFVDFGLHSCYHPVLTKCTASKKCSEIIECKQAIEQVLGQQVFAFAFPNGDYDEECIRILKENGLKLARTTDAGWNDIFSDPYRLKVTGVSDSSGMNKLISELTGIPRFLQYLVFKGSLNGQKIKKFNNL